MKKLFALFLAGAMALSLTACGGKTGKEDAAPSVAPEQTVAPDAAAPAGQASSSTATIEPTVLVDEQGVKITANELRCTDYAVEMVLALENNSDKDLSFRSGTLGYSRNSVNGYMMEGLYVGADVPAGKKANETVSLSKDELLFYGIADIADIELAFDINDSDYNDYLQTEPAQIKTSLAGSYDYDKDTYQEAIRSGDAVAALGGTVDHFAADEAYSEQGVRIVSQALLTGAGEEPVLFVELENTSDQMVTVYMKDICVNGLQVYSGTWTSDDINAGKRRVVTLAPCDMLDAAYWEPYGLDTVGEMAYTIALEDAGGSALCDDVPVTFTVPGAEAAYRSDGEELYSEGGVRILNMGIVPDAAGERFGTHLLLLAENGTEKAIQFDVGYDTLSVNGYMTDFFCIGPTLAPGRSGVVDVELSDDSLTENGIEAAEDIVTVELTFEIQDDHYNDLASPTVTIGESSQPAADGAAAGDVYAADAVGSAEAADIPGVSPELKEMLDSYEAFFDEYIAFMQSYQSSGNSTSMMMDYLSFLTKYADAMQKLEAIDTDSLSDADLAYYTQVMLRISTKLAGAAA